MTWIRQANERGGGELIGRNRPYAERTESDAVKPADVDARTVEQLDDNLAAADLELHAEEIAQLDAATAPDAMYPATVDHQWGFPEPPYTEGAAIPERLVRQDGTHAD